jgi:hypothetical protein
MAVTDSNNQSVAFKKLTSAGMSVSQAMSAVQDSTLAAAIASKSFSSKELKQIVIDANRAEKALARIQAIQSLRSDISDAAGELDLQRRFREGDTKFSAIQQFAIETDATLLETYTQFLAGKIKTLPKEFGERLAQIVGDVVFQQRAFDEAFNNAMDAFAAQEGKIRLDFELGINDSGLNKDKLNLSKLREEIALDENNILNINAKIDDYDAGLTKIAEDEEKINNAYDKRFEALDKIERANEAISRQQKSQLTIADALSQGDIAAAAKAAQDMRAEAASQSIQSQREMLELSRDNQVKALQTTINGQKLTREEIETRIKKLQKDIFDIEEASLEPKRLALQNAEFQIEKAIKSLEIAGLTRAEWEKQKNNIDVARTSTEAYNTALKAALDLVSGIVAYWNSLDGKVVKTTHIIEEKVVKKDSNDTFNIMKDSPLAVANKEYFEKVLDDIATGKANISQIADYAAAVNDALGTPGAQVALARGGIVKGYARGGRIPKYMAAGGMFRPRGTDTVPAMLTPGEFVVRKYAVDSFGTDKLKAINNGTYKGDSMYNYEVNVSVQTDANPDQIARAVMGQIKQIDAQRIRGNRF